MRPDDVQSWVLGPDYDSPGSSQRLSFMWYRAKVAWALCSNKKSGIALGLRDEGTSEVIGVLLAQRITRGGGSFKKQNVRASEVGKVPDVEKPGTPARARLLALDSAAKTLAFQGVQYQISALAVHPAHQGRGYASSLVRAAFALGDRDGLPVTVECAGERMEALYTHLGLEKHAQAAVDDPTNQTKKLAMVSMVRLPRSAAPAAQ